MVGKENENLLLAKFDSDEYTAIDKANNICGLKRLDFSAGYTVSFSAKAKGSEATVPLMIEQINDASLATATLETEPSWYTEYANIPQITLSGAIHKGYIPSNPLVIPAASFTYPLRGTETYDVAKIELQKDGGAWVPVSAGDEVSEVGNYKLRYTAVDGGVAVSNVLEKSFAIYKETHESLISCLDYGEGEKEENYYLFFNKQSMHISNLADENKKNEMEGAIAIARKLLAL